MKQCKKRSLFDCDENEESEPDAEEIVDDESDADIEEDFEGKSGACLSTDGRTKPTIWSDATLAIDDLIRVACQEAGKRWMKRKFWGSNSNVPYARRVRQVSSAARVDNTSCQARWS